MFSASEALLLNRCDYTPIVRAQRRGLPHPLKRFDRPSSLMIQFFPHAWFCLFNPLPPGASGKRTNACTIGQALRSCPLFMGGWGLGFGRWRLGLLVGSS